MKGRSKQEGKQGRRDGTQGQDVKQVGMGVREGAGALTLAEVGKSRPLFVALCLHLGTEVALAFTLGAGGLGSRSRLCNVAS